MYVYETDTRETVKLQELKLDGLKIIQYGIGKRKVSVCEKPRVKPKSRKYIDALKEEPLCSSS